MTGFAYRIDADGRAERHGVKDALAADAPMIWVHLSIAAEHAQTWLAQEAGLAPYIVDALTQTETRPRFDQFDGGGLLNLRGRSDEELTGSDPLASVRIWGVRGRVYSVTAKHLVATDAVERQVEAGCVRDPGDLIAAFATAITSDLDPLVAKMGDDLDDAEEQLDTERAYDLRRIVARVRIEAIGFRRFLQPQRAALEKLAAAPGDWLADDDRAHLAAAADRAARMAEEVEAIRERAGLIHETLTDLRAEQLDQRGLVIAIVAMIFLPLTFLTGVYGMNIDGLPLAHGPHAFEYFVAMCLVVTVPVLGWFVRKHWF